MSPLPAASAHVTAATVCVCQQYSIDGQRGPLVARCWPDATSRLTISHAIPLGNFLSPNGQISRPESAIPPRLPFKRLQQRLHIEELLGLIRIIGRIAGIGACRAVIG